MLEHILRDAKQRAAPQRAATHRNAPHRNASGANEETFAVNRARRQIVHPHAIYD